MIGSKTSRDAHWQLRYSRIIKHIYKTFIDLEKDTDSRSERMFKEKESYGLSPEEISSDVQIWKILLAKRVEETSHRAVYEEIMSHFNE